MIILSTSREQQEYGQFTPDPEKFVRKRGSYNIAEIVGKVSSHATSTKTDQINDRKIAVISGAGIAGLAAAFELNAKGFDVVIAEKRDEFSRFNMINLNMEVQAFLEKFNLLEEFEATVAARISHHQVVAFGKNGIESFPISDVSKLKFDKYLNKDPTKFKDLFQEDGIYSVHIKDLQAFLAQKAAKLGVRILSNSEINFVDRVESRRVSKIKITQKNSSSSSLTLKPDLFFIAEGAHSATARQLGMVDDLKDVVNNACAGENWIFGNLDYKGNETFVISMIMTSQKVLRMANVIFNAKSGIVNVAVTSDENPSKDGINDLIQETAKKAFDYLGIKEVLKVLETVEQPVPITNRIASLCSRENVFRIGDSVGNSSPLAGAGGTLGLTLVPCTVEQLVEDIENRSGNEHSNFKTSSQAYVKTWIDKSQAVKMFIQGVFKNGQSSAMEPKDPAQNKEALNAT